MQIQPNATIAIQNISSLINEEDNKAMAPYVHDVEERYNYIQRIRACNDSVTLCKTVLADLYNDQIADCIKSQDLIKSKEFITSIMPLLSFECGVENLRIAIRKYVLGEIK